jgi:hypothetical protein
VANGDFWFSLLPKALKNEKTLSKAIAIFFDTVVPFCLMEDNVQKLYACWNFMFSKMSDIHDPKLKRFITDPQPVLKLCDAESSFNPLPLLEILNKEAFYLLKNVLLSKQDYNQFFDFLSKHATNEKDALDYLTVYLHSTNQAFIESGSALEIGRFRKNVQSR